MFTVKVFYSSGQTNLFEADAVNIGSDGKRIGMNGAHCSSDFTLDGTETVYVENEAGKTVHVIRPGNSGSSPPTQR